MSSLAKTPVAGCRCSNCLKLHAFHQEEFESQQKGFHTSSDEKWHKFELASYDELGEVEKELRRKKVERANQKEYEKWPTYKKQDFLRFAKVCYFDVLREFKMLVFCDICLTFGHNFLSNLKIEII